MGVIDKVQISGATYDVRDSDAARIEAVTGNLFSLEKATWTDSETINTTAGSTPKGAIISSGTMKLSSPFPLSDAFLTLYLWRTAYGSGSHYLRIGFYNASDEPLDGVQVYTGTTGGQKSVPIPAGAVSFRVAGTSADMSNPLTVSYAPLTGHIAYGDTGAQHALSGALAEVSGRTASRAFAPGELIALGGTLYRITAAVAQGSALVAGTNIEATKISDLMSGHTVNVSGSTATIAAVSGVRYLCGTMTELSVTPSAGGLCEVVFTSGTTPTVLTLPQTVVMPDWWTGVEASRTYDIMIADGVRGAVMSWAT